MNQYKAHLCDNTGRWDEHSFELKAGEPVLNALDTVRHFCEHYMTAVEPSVIHSSDVHFTLYAKEAGKAASYIVKRGTCDAIYS